MSRCHECIATGSNDPKNASERAACHQFSAMARRIGMGEESSSYAPRCATYRSARINPAEPRPDGQLFQDITGIDPQIIFTRLNNSAS